MLQIGFSKGRGRKGYARLPFQDRWREYVLCVDERNYCAHCGKFILPENEEGSTYVEFLMVKLFCEECGKITFIRWEDRIER